MAAQWTEDQVSDWLSRSGFSKYVELFKEEEIDGVSLLHLTENDIGSLFPKAGPKSKFRMLLEELKIKETLPIPNYSDVVVHESRSVPPCSSQHENSSSCTSQQSCSTVQFLLSNDGMLKKMTDRYQPLRVRGIKVYEKDYIQNLPPLRKQYFEFKNEESLKLVQSKTQKNMIDGMVNINWRLWGRRKALKHINSTEIHYDVEQVNPFEKYDRLYCQKQEEIIEVDKELQERQDELTESIKTGTISSNGKKNMYELISTFKKRRENIILSIDCIAKNWDTAMRKYLRTGPPKKRGRKVKTSVVYKTARELKPMIISEDDEESTQIENTDMFGENVMDDNSDLLKEDIFYAEKILDHETEEANTENTNISVVTEERDEENNSGNTSTSVNKIVEDIPFVGNEIIDEIPVKDTVHRKFLNCMRDVTSSDVGKKVLVVKETKIVAVGQLKSVTSFAAMVHLEGCIKDSDLFPSDSEKDVPLPIQNVKCAVYEDRNFESGEQMTVLTMSQLNCGIADYISGSSACMAICLLIAKEFQQGLFPRLCKTSEAIQNIASVLAAKIQEGCDLWHREEYGPSLLQEAALKLNFSINVEKDVWWKTSTGPFMEIYEESLSLKKKQALVVTLAPDHTFVILIDEMGNHVFVNSHLHHKNEKIAFHESVESEKCGAGFVLLPAGEVLSADTFTSYCKLIRVNPLEGEAMSVSFTDSSKN